MQSTASRRSIMAFETLSPVFVALLRYGSRALAQWWRDSFQAPEATADIVASDSQRSPVLFTPTVNTHTVLPPTSHPVLIISYPSDATVQLFEYAQQISPEVILYLCSFGVLCLIFLGVFTTVKLGRRTLRWLISPLWTTTPTPPTVMQPPTNRQLSDIARHWFHFVREQNPELTGGYEELCPTHATPTRRRS